MDKSAKGRLGDNLEEEAQKFGRECVDVETPTKYQHRDVQGLTANQAWCSETGPKKNTFQVQVNMGFPGRWPFGKPPPS